MKYLVETCLLTHGLKSITNQEIKENWPDNLKNITWVDQGKIILGDVDTYLTFRDRHHDVIRIDCFTLDEAIREKKSGALTASGTMAVCKRLGYPLAITCGMGGIGKIKGEELCPDLPALEKLPVWLITTGPKDMLDRKSTFDWLKEHKVVCAGVQRDYCSGYIFDSGNVQLDGIFDPNLTSEHLLIVNEIPEEIRVQDAQILEKAVEYGHEAEERGEYFHPAVNGRIDELTEGYSSIIQLDSLIENIKLAKQL